MEQPDSNQTFRLLNKPVEELFVFGKELHAMKDFAGLNPFRAGVGARKYARRSQPSRERRPSPLRRHCQRRRSACKASGSSPDWRFSGFVPVGNPE
jgi:hypothetical protein